MTLRSRGFRASASELSSSRGVGDEALGSRAPCLYTITLSIKRAQKPHI